MAFIKKQKIIRKYATYRSNKNFQGGKSTFTMGFDKKPPKTIKGEHNLIYRRVGPIKRKKIIIRRIGKYTIG